MFTKETAITKAKEFIAGCEKKQIFFNKVILFGSVLNSTANEWSDIDLLLVSDKFGYDNWENAKLIASVNKHFSMIDAHTFSTEYYLKGDPLINEINRTGITLIA